MVDGSVMQKIQTAVTCESCLGKFCRIITIN